MDNFVMKMVLAVADFLLINVALSLAGIDFYSVFWYMLCVALGFGLRIAMLVKESKYSTRNLLLHMAISICWCFLMVLVWRTALNKTWINQGGNSFEIYLFINSLFSVYLVGQAEILLKTSLKQWLVSKLSSLIAKDNTGKVIVKDNMEDSI